MDYYLLPDAFAFTLSGSPTPLDLEWATPNETYNSSNFAAEPSLLHEVQSLPAATVPLVTNEPPAYDQWDGLMYPFEVSHFLAKRNDRGTERGSNGWCSRI